MPNIYDNIYKKYNLSKTSIYIETGCYLGRGIIKPKDNKYSVSDAINGVCETIGILHSGYDKIYSIELVEKYYNLNKEQFKNFDHVNIIHGDSSVKLEELLSNINVPVTVFLDAHWSGGDTGRLNKDTPLLEELDILKKRKYNDIIIIDDTRCIGKYGNAGRKGNKNYPPMKFDWSYVTLSDIEKRIKENYIVLNNENKDITDGKVDQLILIPKID
jgi:hypothetical protein